MLFLLLLLGAAAGALPAGLSSALNQFCLTTTIRDSTNWCVTGSDPCTWDGVECSSGGDAIDALLIEGDTISGTWPTAFDNTIVGLNRLAIGVTNLTGSIAPALFSRLATTLTVFSSVSSPVSFAIGSLALLEAAIVITVIDTPLTGSVADSDDLAAMNLFSFVVQFAGGDGEFPPTYFDNTAGLQLLLLDRNAFSGAAPNLCGTISTIDLSHNRFTSFPSCYQALDISSCDMRNNYKCSDGGVPPNAPGQDCLFDEFPNAPVDACGVCAGSGESCTDCAGVEAGTAEADVCGVCNGDGTSCLDCTGTVNGNEVYDLCAVCGGSNDCLDCAGVPNGPASGDVCGVCNGDGTSCFDCAGVLSGSSAYDVCDVCDGDGTGCDDCFGVPAGPARLDACGVCGGFNACVDCTGTPNGSRRYDRCGVCGGSGTSCGIGEVFQNARGLDTGIIIAVSIIALLLLAVALCIYLRA